MRFSPAVARRMLLLFVQIACGINSVDNEGTFGLAMAPGLFAQRFGSLRVKRSGNDETLRCSFCHKAQDVVGKLISSPSEYPRAYICDECIAVCNSILEDDRAEREWRRTHQTAKTS